MKVWVEYWGEDYYIHFQEPEPGNECNWTSGRNHVGWSIEEIILRSGGFKKLPEPGECAEYSLASKKPKWICTWVKA